MNNTNGSNGQVLLEVKNLRKHFPIRRGLLQRVIGHVRAVDDVDFYINKGETLSLVGESGCGKTTTSRCILRALQPTDGSIIYRTGDDQTIDLAGVPKKKLRPLRREMQMRAEGVPIAPLVLAELREIARDLKLEDRLQS